MLWVGGRYAQRLVLPIAIVRMQSEFGWTKLVQGQLLGTFFIGYASMMPLGGMLATNLPPSKLIGAAMLVSSVLALAMPAAAHGGVQLFSALRIVQGVVQGVMWPSYAAMWTRWAPPAERSTMSSFPQCGGYVGNIVFAAVIGWQIDRDEGMVLGGWAAAFRFSAVIGLGWSILWLILVRDSPAKQPGCGVTERGFIESALAAETARHNTGSGGESSAGSGAGSSGGDSGAEDLPLLPRQTDGKAGGEPEPEPAGGAAARPGLRFCGRALVTPAVLGICLGSWGTNISFCTSRSPVSRSAHSLSVAFWRPTFWRPKSDQTV